MTSRTSVPILEVDEKDEFCQCSSFNGATKEQKYLIIRVISAITCTPVCKIDISDIENLLEKVKKSILNNKGFF